MPANPFFSFEQPEQNPGFLLWQVSMAWQRQLKQSLDPLGITLTQFVLLAGVQWLTRADAPCTRKELATYANTDPMMTSKVLRTLQGKGMVARTEDERDSRAKTIRLTPVGQAMHQEAMKRVEQADARFFQPLGQRVTQLLPLLEDLYRVPGP